MTFGAFLVRGITRPLNKAVQVADEVAEGKLDGVLRVESADETGQLINALNKMQSVLQRFQAAQTEMADQHDAGKISHFIDPATLPGSYGGLASATNAMVKAHIDIQVRAMGLVERYITGSFEEKMQDLPGEKRRITDAINLARDKMAAAAEAATFNQRIRLSLDSLPVCVTVSNAEALLVHATPPAKELLKFFGGPAFDADKFYGNKLSTLFKSPDDAMRFDQAVRTGETVDIEIQGRKIRLLARPVHSTSGEPIGRITQWIDRTDEIASEKQLDDMVLAATRGDFSGRLSLEGKSGFFASVSNGMNQLMQTSEQGLTDVADILSAFAQGDLTKRIERDYAGLFGQLKDSTNTTADSLTRVIGEVRGAADALTGAANQVSATAQSLSQAASVEETTSQIDVMSASISQHQPKQ